MNISDILRWKAANGTTDVFTTAPDEPVTELLRSLADHNVGALVVIDGGDVIGMVSERDIVRRIAERGAATLAETVGHMMTTSVVTCTAHDSIDSIAETMTQRRIRHMPVMADNGELAGLVSIGDVVSHRMRQLEKDRGQLEHYISG
jgi:CBS domain-containing protein